MTTVIVSGCQGGNDANGYGYAVVALQASATYALDDELHGRVLLVDETGAVGSIETEGLYFGSVSFDDGKLYASDASSEAVITARSVTRLQRAVDHDMEWWAGVVEGRRWTLFNDGTGDTDDYHTGVAVTDDALVAEGNVGGDVVGTTECDGRLILAVGRWNAPRDHRGTRLVWLTADNGGIQVVARSRVALPPGARVVNLACSDGDLVVLAMKKSRTLISQHPVKYRGRRQWSSLPEARVSVSGDSILKGVVGTELLFWEPGMGVRALDLRTFDTRQVVTFAHATEQVGVDGAELLTWEPSIPALRWYDIRTGEAVREIAGDEVAEVLGDNDETVDAQPVSLVSTAS